ncbi:hypothetical protein BDA99DRAFT_520117 [Phascolomyces articulosus]|uniref:Uncharacterized protein n=1 Tax=Phascolomyces articulosus TaxID=60185 RepID=A0AAD5K3I9_9FUNG|nr:hypothetical protein BDA99DRAFT_520117 [Phascolomyces articulosus]
MTDLRSFEMEQPRRSESLEHSFVGEDNDDPLTTSPTFSNIHTSVVSGDRYRSLVNESPPANFNARTPQDEQRMELKHSTPSPFKRESSKVLSPVVSSPIKQRSSHSSPITREFRTPSEWDELMRSKGIIPPNNKKDDTLTEKAATTTVTAKAALSPQKSNSVSIQQKQTTTTARHQKKHMTTTSSTLLSEPTKSSNLPSYMRATASYESRLLRPHHEFSHTPRQKYSNIKPRFQSSTRINAMDDIHNEMRDEDVYIPLAVRIKLFEQNLRGGNPISSRSIGSIPRQNKPNDTHLPSTTSSLTKPRSPKLLTRQRTHSFQRSSQSQSSQEGRQPLSTEQTNANTTNNRHRTISRYNRTRTTITRKGHRSSTLASANRASHSSKTAPTSKSSTLESNIPLKPSKKQKTIHTTSVQPFRFATDERAVHHQKQFKAKLDLWKEKEKKIQDEACRAVRDAAPQLHRGTKRKVQEN